MWCELPYTPLHHGFIVVRIRVVAGNFYRAVEKFFMQASSDAARSLRACAPGQLHAALLLEPATPATAFCCVAPSPTGRGPLRTPRVMEDPSVPAERAPTP